MSVAISVIIPVYNTAAFIPDCLGSVINQTFRDIEIICIDDGSTDNSLAILNEYAATDSRISVMTQDNSGVVTARNNGIKKAVGKYLFFLDSDDVIAPDCLERLHQVITTTKYGVVAPRVMKFGCESGEMLLPKITKINMSRGNCLVNAALMRRELVDRFGGFDRAFDAGIEDYDFWQNLIFKNVRFTRDNDAWFYYRIKPSDLSRQKQIKSDVHVGLMRQLHEKYPEMDKYKRRGKIRDFLYRDYVNLANGVRKIKILKIPVYIKKVKK